MPLPTETLDHYRRILKSRREQLAAGTTRATAEIGDQSDLERLDPVDRANAAEAKDALLQEAQRDSEGVEAIDEALRRIDRGEYGVCEVCGKEIEAQRLKAVPWTSLCREDQERADQRRSASYAQGGAPSRVA